MGKIVKKGVVVRKPGYLYYIDSAGNVCEAKMSRGGKKKKAAKKVKKKPVKKPVKKTVKKTSKAPKRKVAKKRR